MKNSTLFKVAISTLFVASFHHSHARNDHQESELISDQISRKPHAIEFIPGTSYTLCFVPDGPRCENLLVSAINSTKKTLLIQAYSFTSPAIAQAVSRAHTRGVDVRIIVDKSQVSEKYTSSTFLKNAGIPIAIDIKPAIAHNKVMIFDDEAIFTGSFNFTKAAQNRNTENGILIQGDAAVVKAYSDNWLTRFKQSTPY